jgi:hypothetical protein
LEAVHDGIKLNISKDHDLIGLMQGCFKTINRDHDTPLHIFLRKVIDDVTFYRLADPNIDAYFNEKALKRVLTTDLCREIKGIKGKDKKTIWSLACEVYTENVEEKYKGENREKFLDIVKLRIIGQFYDVRTITRQNDQLRAERNARQMARQKEMASQRAQDLPPIPSHAVPQPLAQDLERQYSLSSPQPSLSSSIPLPVSRSTQYLLSSLPQPPLPSSSPPMTSSVPWSRAQDPLPSSPQPPSPPPSSSPPITSPVSLSLDRQSSVARLEILNAQLMEAVKEGCKSASSLRVITQDMLKKFLQSGVENTGNATPNPTPNPTPSPSPNPLFLTSSSAFTSQDKRPME